MDSIEIKSLDKEHIIHSWMVNDDLDPLVIKDVEGPYLIDGYDKMKRLSELDLRIEGVVILYFWNSVILLEFV